MAATVLHDTVEDTDAIIEDIEAKFGHRVAELVASESENRLNQTAACRENGKTLSHHYKKFKK